MIVQLTNAGVAAIDAAAGPITLGTFKLGSDVNYTPVPTDTDIHGTELFSGIPTPYGVVNANVVKYSVILDPTVGTFGFGELGLYMTDGTLFALATAQSLINKIQNTSAVVGNSIRIDVYLSIVGTNYDMWFDVAESNNPFRIAVLQSVDVMPPPQNAVPNAYIVSPASSDQSAFQAYTDRTGLWNFDCYQFANQASVTIVSATSTSITISASQFLATMTPAYFGQIILEFSSGAVFGICRYVLGTVTSGSLVTLSFQTPLALIPAVGDTAIVFSRTILSTTTSNLPIATATALGAIKVGTTLTITTDGVLNVNSASFPVTSVNGETGDVTVSASNITGFAAVAYSGQYTDIIGAPGAYTLPIATTTRLGGVKAPTGGSLSIAADGTIDINFAVVKTVNGISADGSGNIQIPAEEVVGLVDPAALTSAEDFNTVLTAGLYYADDTTAQTLLNGPVASASMLGGVLEVIPFTTTGTGGDVIQRWNDDTYMYFRRYTASSGTWSSWIRLSAAAPAVATTTSTGVVQVGAGLAVTTVGVLSTVIQSVNGQAQQAVLLAASDVGALDVNSRGAQGGVAGLDEAPTGSTTPDTDVFTYGRIPYYENTLGTWQTGGQWDASANHVNQANSGNTGTDVNTALVAGGLQTIDISYAGTNPMVSTSPDYQTVSASGFVYEVITAGTTNLDGVTSWSVGDLAVAINGTWQKIPSSLGSAASPIVGDFRRLTASATDGSATIPITVEDVIVGTAVDGSTFKITNLSGNLSVGSAGAINQMLTTIPPINSFIGIYAAYNPTTQVSGFFGVVEGTSVLPTIAASTIPGFTYTALLTVVPSGSASDGSGTVSAFVANNNSVGIQNVAIVTGTITSTSQTAYAATTVNVIPYSARRVYPRVSISTSTTSVVASVWLASLNSGVGGGLIRAASVSTTFSEESIDIITPQTIYTSEQTSTSGSTYTIACHHYEV